jgi:hypothetical protein
MALLSGKIVRPRLRLPRKWARGGGGGRGRPHPDQKVRGLTPRNRSGRSGFDSRRATTNYANSRELTRYDGGTRLGLGIVGTCSPVRGGDVGPSL